ncbi:YkyA family protein [Salinicoccus sp. ID82-1]|uniref:YkyA family protein n=1 Tax=Salinicoccus sp. ID82-1 TaxID=2820269 RepID=UPI001F3C7A09|nr:YkyA family protein [Salinicoccus sp. ID82-1]MCG1009464.1 YkyA family protein [Salinicoccus sp. ID82-1]
MGMKKRKLLSGAAVSIMLLSACSNDIESIQQALDGSEEKQASAVSELQQVMELESQLQNAFQTGISEDEDLSSFSDGSAAVFTNIDERKQALENLDGISSELTEQKEKFAEIDVQSVSEETVDEVENTIQSLNESIDAFAAKYGEDLEQQRDYFESLGQDDTTYENFKTGIESINDSREKTQSLLVELDTEIAALQNMQGDLSSQLDAAADE